MRKISGVISAILLTVLTSAPVLAVVSYTAIISVTSNSTYTNLPIIETNNNSFLAANGYISASGLDVQIQSGGTALPRMIVDNRTLFVSNLLLGTNSFNYVTGNTPTASMEIVTGQGGNVTVADSPALELGSIFSLNYSARILATVNDTLINKAGSYAINTTYNGSNGNVTATLFSASIPAIAGNATNSENVSTSNHTFNVPAHNSGDLLILVVSSNPVGAAWTAPVNWTAIVTNQTANIKLVSWYKISDGTEGTTVYGQTSLVARTSSICYRITKGGVPTGNSAQGSGAANINPPPLDVTGNITGKLWLAGFAGVNIAAVDWTTNSSPASYSDSILQLFDTAGGNKGGIVSMNRSTISFNEDPGTFSINSTGSVEWNAFTLTVPGIDVVLPMGNFTSNETMVTVNATTNNVTIWNNGTPVYSLAQSVYVIDNSNGIVMMSSAVPYVNNVTISVNGTRVLWYAPNSIIIGSNLPNRASSSDNGTINFGANPAGITVSSLGTLTPASSTTGLPSLQGGNTPDVLPNTVNIDPTTTSTPTNPFSPFIGALATLYDFTALSMWFWFGLIVTIAVFIGMAKFSDHLGWTLIATSLAMGGFSVIHVFPIGMLYIAILILITGVIVENRA